MQTAKSFLVVFYEETIVFKFANLLHMSGPTPGAQANGIGLGLNTVIYFVTPGLSEQLTFMI